MKSWLLLLSASAVEVVMAYALKESDSFSKALPTLLGVVAALLSIFLLASAMRDIPLGTAYVVWTGIGAVGVVLVGACLFGEHLSLARAVLLAMVIAGTAGLRFLEG